MLARRHRYALLIPLLLFAGPAAAQWSVHYQQEKGSAWVDVTNQGTSRDEERARAGAARACIDRANPAISRYASKFVSPAGKETVTLCQAPDRPPSRGPIDSPEAQAFVGICPTNPWMKIFVDCQCAVAALRAMPPEPPTTTGAKDAVARASEACPTTKAHMEREYYVQCLPQLTHTGNKDAASVCRCMATDVASKYLLNPVASNLRHLEQLRREAMKACWTAGGG